MAEVDFSRFDQSLAWFKAQPHETRCIMSARAALRIAANFGPYKHETRMLLVLSSFRANRWVVFGSLSIS